MAGSNSKKAARGKKLPSANSFPVDLPMFLIIMILIVFGLVMMFSASYAWAMYEAEDGTKYIKRQLVFCILGLFLMFVASKIDYRIFKRPILAFGIYGVALILLILVLLVGIERNDSKRWLGVDSFSFQPSEVMKFAIIILFAYLISVNYSRMKTFKYGIIPFLLFLAPVAALMMLQPHLSGTILICAIGVALMFVGGSRLLHLIGIGAAGVAGIVGVVFYLASQKGFSYFETRIQSWLDPFADGLAGTWQTKQSLIAIGSGGMFGLGLGNSRQKYLYLPEAENDFVFAVVCEELGFIGAMLVLLLFVLFIFRGFYIATKAPDKFGMMVCVGLTVQIGLQALLNIAVVTNTIPNTGISLPFFSYGGTAYVMQLAQMGILLNISRHSSVIIEETDGSGHTRTVEERG